METEQKISPASQTGPDNAGVSQKPGKIAVFYDVDGTLLKSNIVQLYLYYTLRMPRLHKRLGGFLKLLAMVPAYKVVDLFSRKRFNIFFYKNYRGINVDRLHHIGEEIAHKLLLPNIYEDAKERIATARRLGHHQVLVTGSLGYMIDPLAKALQIDDVITNTLEIDDYGMATGKMLDPILAEQGKRDFMEEYAIEHNIDLSRSYAFADSKGDLEMLETVGFPCVINPDKALRKIAEKATWPILEFA